MLADTGQNTSMWLWLIIGSIAFLLGAIGLFLPIWPTTIFWIIAAASFARSRPEWRDWIYARPGIGKVIEGFVERRELSGASKTAALAGIAIAGGLSAWSLWGIWTWMSITAALLLIGAFFVLTARPVR